MVSFAPSNIQRNHQINGNTLREKYMQVGDVCQSVFHGTKLSKYPSDYSGLFIDNLFKDYVTFNFFKASEYAIDLNTIKTNNLKILELIKKSKYVQYQK